MAKKLKIYSKSNKGSKPSQPIWYNPKPKQLRLSLKSVCVSEQKSYIYYSLENYTKIAKRIEIKKRAGFLFPARLTLYRFLFNNLQVHIGKLQAVLHFSRNSFPQRKQLKKLFHI